MVSGIFGHGPPHAILERAVAGAWLLFVTPSLLAELQRTLTRPKFDSVVRASRRTPAQLVTAYARQTRVIRSMPIPPVIVDDPDDDAVLACAVAARARTVVSGDRHLLALGAYRGIRILTPAAFLAEVGT